MYSFPSGSHTLRKQMRIPNAKVWQQRDSLCALGGLKDNWEGVITVGGESNVSVHATQAHVEIYERKPTQANSAVRPSARRPAGYMRRRELLELCSGEGFVPLCPPAAKRAQYSLMCTILVLEVDNFGG